MLKLFLQMLPAIRKDPSISPCGTLCGSFRHWMLLINPCVYADLALPGNDCELPTPTFLSPTLRLVYNMAELSFHVDSCLLVMTNVLIADKNYRLVKKLEPRGVHSFWANFRMDWRTRPRVSVGFVLHSVTAMMPRDSFFAGVQVTVVPTSRVFRYRSRNLRRAHCGLELSAIVSLPLSHSLSLYVCCGGVSHSFIYAFVQSSRCELVSVTSSMRLTAGILGE